MHAAELLANAATNSNTASAIVKRDASGNFAAGTITSNTAGATNAIDATTTGAGWAGHFDGSAAGTGVWASGNTTGLQVNNGSVLLSHTDQGAGNFAVGAGTNAVLALDAGAAPVITLNKGTNGQVIYIFNGSGNVATFAAGTSSVHPANITAIGATNIPAGNTLILIYVTNAAGSGWVTK